MKRLAIYSFSIIVFVISAPLQTSVLASASSGPRPTTLVLQPSRLETGKVYTLLVGPQEQVEGDAAPLYDQAARDLLKNVDIGQLTDWIRMPLGELPQDEVQAFLQRAQPVLEAVAKATRCKDCHWPAFDPQTMLANLSEYRQLAYMFHLQARQQIARRQYDDAAGTLRTGLTMARQVGEAPTLVQGLVGIAMAAVMLRGVDDLAQAPDSPNLYQALAALPRPFVDIEKPIATEQKALETSTEYTGAVREVMRQEVEPAYERTRQLARRLSADISARQCLEALRHYAATHEGGLPAGLSDISGVDLPNDPVTQEPFKYRLDGDRAILETTPPEGGSPREMARFEISVAR